MPYLWIMATQSTTKGTPTMNTTTPVATKNTFEQPSDDMIAKVEATGRSVAEYIRDRELDPRSLIDASLQLVDSPIRINRAYAHAVLAVFGVIP
jgi:hypothetical protein